MPGLIKQRMPRDFTCLIVGTHFMCNITKCHYSTPEIKLKLLLLSAHGDTTASRHPSYLRRTKETKTIIVPNVQVRMNRQLKQTICHSIYLASHAPLLLLPSVLLKIFIVKDSINRTKHIDLKNSKQTPLLLRMKREFFNY